MESFQLLKPDCTMIDEISAYRIEMMEADSSMDGTGKLQSMENIEDWLEFCRLAEDSATVPEGLVPATQYLYVRESDQKIVGMIQLRHVLNDFLFHYGGHIGYSVHPDERRKGYAKRMLTECLKECKARGICKVLVTCKPSNEGSRRTIVSCGGIYENTLYCESRDVYLERYWINL